MPHSDSRCLGASSQIIPSLVTPLDGGEAMDVEADPEKMLHPFRHGMVQDWEMVESIYNYMLYEQARFCLLCRCSASRLLAPLTSTTALSL